MVSVRSTLRGAFKRKAVPPDELALEVRGAFQNTARGRDG